MNRTQKIAVLNLLSSIFGFVLFSFLLTGYFWSKQLPPIFRRLPLVLFLLLILYAFWIHRKQRPLEVDEDERDKLIKTKAASTGFISFLVTLGIALTIAQYYLGIDTTIPLSTITLSSVILGFFSLLVYSAAILFQYGWGKKNE